jgi:hypothetical protein
MNSPRWTDTGFRHQAVRDLAFLLCAPAPWHHAGDLPRQRLLGRDGWQRLCELDARPEALQDWLSRHSSPRLGRYAEKLWQFWFEHAPHIELLAANLLLRAGGRTLGEFDFLLRIDGEPWHVETASKFYLQLGSQLDTLIGPGLDDAWRLKAARLQRQLELSRHPLAAGVLPPGFAGCHRGALLSGGFFYRAQPLYSPPLADDQPHGWMADLDQDWPQRSAHSRWLWLPRLRWLSAARADAAELCAAHALRGQLLGAQSPQMVAEMVFDAGIWREVDRGFVVPCRWPDGHRLSLLRRRIRQAGLRSGAET